jgi:amino acid adenylation domain-containing protein
MTDDMHAAFGHLVEHLAAQDVDAAWEQPAPVPLPAAQHERRRAAERAADKEDALPAVRVHDALLQRAADTPDRPAIITSSRTVTYGELVRTANRLGRRLRELGARPDTLVAVLMDKGWEQVAAVLGILQAGAAYLPIDARLPVQRVAHLIERGEVDIVLTQSSVDSRVPLPSTVRRLHVDDADVVTENDGPLAPVQGPGNLAYVLFTSGSTGQPKGVMVEHRGLVNATLATNARFAVGADDRVLAVTALHHDMSAFDLFGVLGAGGAIVMPDAEGVRDPAHWAELMRRERVTLWNSVPAMMEMLLEYADDRPQALPDSLRLAFLGGDWIPLSAPDRLRAHVDAARIVSVGGPTETTLWNIWFPVERVDPAWKSIPYGRPIPRTRYYVLDETLEERPDWVPGELCCAGVGVARGYWRDDTRTAERFVVHPRTGERLYRTGDLGRRHPDGHIEFLGRVDFQIKIQGHRIEPGEIEFALARHSAVRAAVVTSHRNPQGQPSLVAYVVTDRPADTSTATTSPVTASSTTMPGGDVVTDRIARLEFKLHRHGLRQNDSGPSVALAAPAASEGSLRPFIERRSYRVHASDAVPLASLGHLLAVLRGVQMDGLPLPKYRYGSGGGLYPVQTYVAVQPGRVSGLDAGLYYHHPEAHRLIPIAPGAVLDPQIHVATNQALHDRSAFSIFLVGKQDAIAPLYGDAPARHFMTLEAGAMAHLLESEAPACGIGLCQIGSLEFGGVRDLLGLDAGHVFLHCLIAGPIEKAAQDPAALLRDWNAYQIAPVNMAAEPPPASGLGEELKAFLRDQLPEYMVPPAFVLLDALPLSANGKVDRRALPAPDLSSVSMPEMFVAPRNDTERRLAALWRELLGVEEISASHQFFDLGGNSVQAMQLIAKIRDAFGIAVSVRLLFSSPTLAGLAAELDRLQTADAPESPQRQSAHDTRDASADASTHLRFSDAPLLALVSAGSVAPVDAAALFSLPDNVPQHLGWSRDEFVNAWCEGGLPHPFSILDTSHGRIAVIMLPRYTSDLYADRADLARVALQAIETAGRLGARTVSLTGIVSSATDYGRDLAAALTARPDLPRVTTGHATTAATVLLAVERLLADAGRTMATERLAVIGLGSIGTSTLRLLLRQQPHPRELILCDVLSKARQLEQLRDDISRSLGFKGRVRLVSPRGALPDDVYDASLIIGATNVPDVLDVARLRPGTLIVDDSAPHCFSAEAAIERLSTAGDLLFTEGGMVRLPRPMTELRHIPVAARARLDAAQLAIFSRVNPQELTGCVYSSLLSARTPSLPPTTGPVDLETCEAHYLELVRLGISAAELHCEGFVGRHDLPRAAVDRFRRQFSITSTVSQS